MVDELDLLRQLFETDPAPEDLGVAEAVVERVLGKALAEGPAPLGGVASLARRRRRLVLPSLAAVLVVILGVALTFTLNGQPGAQGPTTTTPNRLSPAPIATRATRIGGITLLSDNLNQVVAQAPRLAVRTSTIRYPDLGANRSAIAFGAGRVWVLQSTKPLGGPANPLGGPAPASDCGALVRLDPSTMAATGTAALGTCPIAVAFGNESVWVLSFRIGTAGYDVSQIDPATMTVRSTTLLDGGPGGVTLQGDTGAKYLFIAVTGHRVIVAVQTATGSTQVITINAADGHTIGSVTIGADHGEATTLSTNRHAIWVGTTAGWLYRIDPATGAATTDRQLGTSVISLSASERAVWVTVALPPGDPSDAYPGIDTLELDPATGALTHDTRLPLVLVSTDGAEVWGIFATARHGDYIARIDPATGTVSGATSSPFTPTFTPDTIAVNSGNAWIINTNLQTLTKVTAAHR
jgi:hypothetical protein